MDLKADKFIRPAVSGISAFFNKVLKADFRMQLFTVPFRVYAEGMELVVFEEFPTGELARHMSRDLNERNALLNDPKYRKRFKRNMKAKLTPKIWQKDFGDAYVVDAPDKSLIGKSFVDIAKERNQHPVDTFLDLVVEMDKEILWETTIGNHDYIFSILLFLPCSHDEGIVNRKAGNDINTFVYKIIIAHHIAR